MPRVELPAIIFKHIAQAWLRVHTALKRDSRPP